GNSRRAPGRFASRASIAPSDKCFLHDYAAIPCPGRGNIVFDTEKVYTERDTRTSRVFIIGVGLLRFRDKGGQRKERERWHVSRRSNACKNSAIFCAPGGLGWRLKTWGCHEEAGGERTG